jgi:hypothetical protein
MFQMSMGTRSAGAIMSVAATIVYVGTACTPHTDESREIFPPEASILSPAPSELVALGIPTIEFMGTVTDEFDKATDLHVTWSVDNGPTEPVTATTDGHVSLEYPLDSLDIGPHRISLKVTDSDEEFDFVTVQFEVMEAPYAPQVDMLEPAAHHVTVPGRNITFVATVNDTTTPNDELLYEWASDVDGVLEGSLETAGESRLETNALRMGTHVVSLTVTDGDGEVGKAEVVVAVNEIKDSAGPGDIVFSEMMIDPEVVDDSNGEWVELYNTSAYAIDISGIGFAAKGTSYTQVANQLVHSGGYVVLCTNTDTLTNGGVSCHGELSASPSEVLENATDNLTIVGHDGSDMDTVSYDEEWFMPGAALGLDPQFLYSAPNTDAERWCIQSTIIVVGGEAGTPGSQNDPC